MLVFIAMKNKINCNLEMNDKQTLGNTVFIDTDLVIEKYNNRQYLHRVDSSTCLRFKCIIYYLRKSAGLVKESSTISGETISIIYIKR